MSTTPCPRAPPLARHLCRRIRCSVRILDTNESRPAADGSAPLWLERLHPRPLRRGALEQPLQLRRRARAAQAPQATAGRWPCSWTEQLRCQARLRGIVRRFRSDVFMDAEIACNNFTAQAGLKTRLYDAPRDHQDTHGREIEMYFTSRYSSRPQRPPSRPIPEFFTPPNGACGAAGKPSFTPTMP